MNIDRNSAFLKGMVNVGGVVALPVEHRTGDLYVAGSSPASIDSIARRGLGQLLLLGLHLCASVTKQYRYRPKGSDALRLGR